MIRDSRGSDTLNNLDGKQRKALPQVFGEEACVLAERTSDPQGSGRGLGGPEGAHGDDEQQAREPVREAAPGTG